MINLLDFAKKGTFKSGRLTDSNNIADIENLPWNGQSNDKRGFIKLINQVRCEDKKYHKVLEMHPKWVNKGTIKAWLPWIKLGKNPMFKAQVGFINGANHTDGVNFQVWEHHMHNGKEVWNMILNLHKKYTGKLINIEADLSHLSNSQVKIELRVDAGKSSGQDWAIWVNPKIVPRGDVAGSAWKFNPVSLTVNDPDDNWWKGSGDEPYMAGLYFRSIFGKPGTTKTKVLTKLAQLGNDVEAGESVTIDQSDELAVSDSAVPFDNKLIAALNGVQIMGYILLPVDEDSGGRGTVRSKFNKIEKSLIESLKKRIENNLIGLFTIEDTFKKIMDDIFPNKVTVGGGGFDLIGEIIKGLGDDPIGITMLLIIGLSPKLIKSELKNVKNLPDFVTIGAPENKTFSLISKSDDAKYTLKVKLQKTSVGKLV
jgi:hypothetical protein